MEAAHLTYDDIPPLVIEAMDFYAEHLPADACWPWPFYVQTQGYGQIHQNGRKLLTHRCAAASLLGTIPRGVLVRHGCDNPPCINPSHLHLGTHADNMRDIVERGRGRWVRWRGMTPEQRHKAVPHLHRGRHPKGQRVQGPDGRVWPSAAAAADDLGLTRQAVAYRCR